MNCCEPATPGPARPAAAVAPVQGRRRRSERTGRGSGVWPRNFADPSRDDRVPAGLVIRAGNGDKQAWDALVEQYAPLIWSICRRHRLGDDDAGDVGQSVWLHLAGQLRGLRDPAALASWLAATTRRECLRVLRAARGPQAAGYVLDIDSIPDEQAVPAGQELPAAERRAGLCVAFTRLPSPCRQLIALLIADPPVPYTEISARLGIPVASIGPNRARCLDKLRRDPAIAALIDAGA
jgi:RNA polymerase sigma factor (sigma-70 family)